MNPQQKQVSSPSEFERFTKKILVFVYTALWLFMIYLYFTFTPIEHPFIQRYWIEDKQKNGVIVRREEWKINLNGVEVPTKLSNKGK